MNSKLDLKQDRPRVLQDWHRYAMALYYSILLGLPWITLYNITDSHLSIRGDLYANGLHYPT